MEVYSDWFIILIQISLGFVLTGPIVEKSTFESGRWLIPIKGQAITQTNVDQVACWRMTSLGHNSLMIENMVNIDVRW